MLIYPDGQSLTIFIEEVNSDRDEGEEGVDDQQSLEDNFVVQVTKSHRLDIDSIWCTHKTKLGTKTVIERRTW